MFSASYFRSYSMKTMTQIHWSQHDTQHHQRPQQRTQRNTEGSKTGSNKMNAVCNQQVPDFSLLIVVLWPVKVSEHWTTSSCRENYPNHVMFLKEHTAGIKQLKQFCRDFGFSLSVQYDNWLELWNFSWVGWVSVTLQKSAYFDDELMWVWELLSFWWTWLFPWRLHVQTLCLLGFIFEQNTEAYFFIYLFFSKSHKWHFQNTRSLTVLACDDNTVRPQ